MFVIRNFLFQMFLNGKIATEMINTNIKGTVQRDFRPPVFSLFKPAWATDQWVKIFSILISFSLSYSNFSESLRSTILRGVSLAEKSPRSIILR